MATLFPFLSPKAQVRAMSSANWAEVTGGKCLAPMVSKLEGTAYTVLFPSKTKLFPSVYMMSSGLVRFSDNPSWVLSSEKPCQTHNPQNYKIHNKCVLFQAITFVVFVTEARGK